ncbi:hypothetical protein PHLCEN_2v8460 [Hermanssonia centrifuga]|uniref:Fungal-type protein kinase domain-containing protein n=1 Tax=Hermanssonia centrifuga TaxID=98765 RepID=A0A2R6NTM0_9APHY|nr:hypothetical protein PHLCEN_2v8460 [Hermanssonia centrifuga]
MADVAPPTQDSTPQIMHPENHKPTDTRSPKDHKYLCVETAGSFVGPVFPKEFMKRFMNIPGRRRKIPRANFSNVLRGTSNADMYDSLISAIKKSKICPRMIFRKLSDITQEDSALRPDLAGFNATDGEPSGNATCWSSMQLCIDNCTEDAFDVAYDPNDREGLRVCQEDDTKSLGQMIHYAREQMSHQHRVFMFSLHIVHDSARIIRWDRMGAVVTGAFDFVLQPQILAEFLFRFNLLGPEGRGFDSSVELAGPDESHEFAEAIASYLDSFGERKPPHFDLTLDASYSTYKLHVIDSGSGVRSSFIVQRPFFETPLPCGRATQGYIAWDVGRRKLVFLKDTWRPVDSDSSSLSEKEAYEILGEHKIPYVPTVLIAEDVLSSTGEPQQTVTQDYSEIPFGSRCAHLRPHIHHRIVQELALPLVMMRRSKQLVQAIRNTLVAIRGAYENAELLHRDISMGNIMLDSNMEGFLNDWDRAIRLSASKEARATRTGTWRFLSIGQLESEDKIHEIHDDLESCFWVLLYAALHHFRHQPVPFDMSIFEEIWDRKDRDGTIHFFGGGRKRAALALRCVTKLEFDCGPLDQAIHHISSTFAEFHRSAVASGVSGDIGIRGRAAHAMVRAELEDPSLIKFLDAVLHREDWPLEDDALFDPYPPPKVQSPRKEEDSCSEQNSPFNCNHSPSPAAISDDPPGACGSQLVIVEDLLSYTKHSIVTSQHHPTSPQTTEHPPSPVFTSGEIFGSGPGGCEANIRIKKRLITASISCAPDEPKTKRPRTSKETLRVHTVR